MTCGFTNTNSEAADETTKQPELELAVHEAALSSVCEEKAPVGGRTNSYTVIESGRLQPSVGRLYGATTTTAPIPMQSDNHPVYLDYSQLGTGATKHWIDQANTKVATSRCVYPAVFEESLPESSTQPWTVQEEVDNSGASALAVAT